jgi:hypothetical protein
MTLETTQKKLTELKSELNALSMSIDRFMVEEVSQVNGLLIS